MRFLIDEQLPPALASFLVSIGHEAQHVRQLQMAGLDDSMLWQHAASAGMVIISKDADFVTRRAMDPAGPAVVWLRSGNTRKQALIERIDQVWPDAITALERGDKLVQII